MATATDTWRGLDDWSKARYRWLLETSLHPNDPRPNQVTPEGDWLIWLVLAGRGWGKTRVAAEDIAEYARTHPGHRIAVVAAKYGDARDVCIEGESGVLSCVPADVVQSWNRSLGELIFTNGARIDLYSAEKPDNLRGPQHHRAWVDELAKFQYLETWDQLMFGLRLGDHPQCIVTTTPKPLPLLRDLQARDTVVVTRGSTFDNARNLSPAALAELRAKYENTQMGRQELYGELLDDYEGALWQRGVIDEYRVTRDDVPALLRIGVGIDPSTWSPDTGGLDHATTGHGVETGIIVAGIAANGHVYILEDASCRKPPHDWGADAIAAFHRHQANAIIPEINMGQGMVTSIIHLLEPNLPVTPVRAGKDGKRARAEPAAALYEKGIVHHVGTFGDLEAQLCSWDPMENYSPDRLDALVWVISWLAPWVNAKATTNRQSLLNGSRRVGAF